MVINKISLVMPYFDGSILASGCYLRAVGTPVYRINLRMHGEKQKEKHREGKKKRKEKKEEKGIRDKMNRE